MYNILGNTRFSSTLYILKILLVKVKFMFKITQMVYGLVVYIEELKDYEINCLKKYLKKNKCCLLLLTQLNKFTKIELFI